MAGDRTEKATPHRKQEARKKGDGVRSRELTGALATLAGVLTMGALAVPFAVNWRGELEQALLFSTRADLSLGSGSAMADLITSCVAPLWQPLALVLGAVLATALVVGVAQNGGLQFSAEALQPQISRINPVTNLGNIFSLRTTARLAKSMIPASLVLIAGLVSIEQDVFALPVLSLARIPALLHAIDHTLVVASEIFLGWSALDYLVEWRSWEQRLRMSREDLREEYKQTEGNPQVRGRIRSIQRALRRRRQEADVRAASVVITNPTHYAVALSFDFETMQAPRVLAKGRNLQAERIKQTARWAGVPIIENPPLARSLFRSVEPGQAIPQDLYAAVAAILAFLYRQRMQEKMQAEERERARQRHHAARASSTGQKTARAQAANPNGANPDGANPWLRTPLLSASTEPADESGAGAKDSGRNDSGESQ